MGMFGGSGKMVIGSRGVLGRTRGRAALADDPAVLALVEASMRHRPEVDPEIGLHMQNLADETRGAGLRSLVDAALPPTRSLIGAGEPDLPFPHDDTTLFAPNRREYMAVPARAPDVGPGIGRGEHAAPLQTISAWSPVRWSPMNDEDLEMPAARPIDPWIPPHAFLPEEEAFIRASAVQDLQPSSARPRLPSAYDPASGSQRAPSGLARGSERRFVGDRGRPVGPQRRYPPAADGPETSRLQAQGAGAAARRIGSLSERYETGGRGPGTVSSGRGDRGGPSYGSYQMASNAGQPQEFLRTDGSQWAPRFRGLDPGTAAYDAQWRAIATEAPEAFAEAQHDYIDRTHFQPAVTAVRRSTGLDLATLSPATVDAVWSTSVQHGTAPERLRRAIVAADSQTDRSAENYEEVLINSIYDERTRFLEEKIANPRTPASERQTYRNIIRNRYPAERQDALRALRQ